MNFTESGNLTRDPELRFTTAGTPVCSFAIAVNRDVTRDGVTSQETDFFEVNAWRKLGEHIAESLKKGDHVLVTGRAVQRKWVMDDGTKRSTFEVNATNVGASLRFATVEMRKVARVEPPDAKVPATVGAPAEQIGEEPF
jgi:single-strand DNA-binding protein